MITNLTYEEIRVKYQFDKHIWEGWEVGDFIRHLEDDLDRVMDFENVKRGYYADEPLLRTKEEIKNWVRNNLPYTIKALREVTKYFVDKYNGMPIFDANAKNFRGKLKLK